MDFADQFEKLSLGKDQVPATLDIRPSKAPASIPTFEKHKLIGKFRTTGKDTCVSDAPIPKLLSSSKHSALIGTDLGSDFKSATLISSYKDYHDQKQKHFLDWLITNKFDEKMQKGEYKKPDFICFGGRITDCMMSPGMDRFGDWKMYAAKFGDSIYLWDEKEGERSGHSKESFYGIGFEHIMTSDNPRASPPNELDKVYVINEVAFGRHQLLCLNEVDAEDEDGDWVELKVFKIGGAPRTLSAKMLKSWAQSVVPGITKVVQGSRNDSGILMTVEVKTIYQVERAAKFWSASACYEFQDRLLTWISSHFKENDPKVAKMFQWRSGSARVYCEDVPVEKIPKLLLPSWYVDKVNQQPAKAKASRSSGDNKDIPVEQDSKDKPKTED